MADHTPTPWLAQEAEIEERGVSIIGLQTQADGTPLYTPTNGMVAWATMSPYEAEIGDTKRAEANAAFIVKAVNSHNALVAALQNVNNLISEAAMTGFNCHDGDWAERLFESQQQTSRALRAALQASEAGR